jgi:hypothetical protein
MKKNFALLSISVLLIAPYALGDATGNGPGNSDETSIFNTETNTAYSYTQKGVNAGHLISCLNPMGYPLGVVTGFPQCWNSNPVNGGNAESWSQEKEKTKKRKVSISIQPKKIEDVSGFEVTFTYAPLKDKDVDCKGFSKTFGALPYSDKDSIGLRLGGLPYLAPSVNIPIGNKQISMNLSDLEQLQQADDNCGYGGSTTFKEDTSNLSSEASKIIADAQTNGTTPIDMALAKLSQDTVAQIVASGSYRIAAGGAVFAFVQGPGSFGKAWKDQNGKIWSSDQGTAETESAASDACNKIGGRLPTKKEYNSLNDLIQPTGRVSAGVGGFLDHEGWPTAVQTVQGLEDLETLFPESTSRAYWTSSFGEFNAWIIYNGGTVLFGNYAADFSDVHDLLHGAAGKFFVRCISP